MKLAWSWVLSMLGFAIFGGIIVYIESFYTVCGEAAASANNGTDIVDEDSD